MPAGWPATSFGTGRVPEIARAVFLRLRRGDGDRQMAPAFDFLSQHGEFALRIVQRIIAQQQFERRFGGCQRRDDGLRDKVRIARLLAMVAGEHGAGGMGGPGVIRDRRLCSQQASGGEIGRASCRERVSDTV